MDDNSAAKARVVKAFTELSEFVEEKSKTANIEVTHFYQLLLTFIHLHKERGKKRKRLDDNVDSVDAGGDAPVIENAPIENDQEMDVDAAEEESVAVQQQQQPKVL